MIIVLLSDLAVIALLVRCLRARERYDRDPMVPPGPVSVIIPAYNEKEGITAAVRAAATGDHPHGIEVVVVDDGSTDGTGDLVEAMGLTNVRVVRPPHRGYVDSISVGLAWSRHDLVVVVDGDGVVEPGLVRLLTGPFADPQVGAVAAHTKVGNRGSWTSRVLHVEYETRLNPARHSRWGRAYAGSGSAVAFRRGALQETGGFSDDTLRPDVDAIISLERDGWKVVYEPAAHAWTEVPSSLWQLRRQRGRWTAATILRVGKYLRAPGQQQRQPDSWSWRAALVGQVAVPVLAPLAEAPLVVAVVTGNADLGVAWASVLAGHILVAAVALRMSRERLAPALIAPLQVLLLRYLNAGLMIRYLQAALRACLEGRQLVRTALSGRYLR